MSSNYTVQQGDYLSKIAKEHGFADYLVIWNHSENAALKKERENPNVLYPGDRLFIPDKEEKELPASTDAKHSFKVKRPRLLLRLRLENLYEKPLLNVECKLRIRGEEFQHTTDDQGKIEQPISQGETEAFLTLKNPSTPVNETVIPMKIGDLNPVTKVSGQKARLNNLGYFAGTPEERDDQKERAKDEMTFLSAVEEFQCDHGLVVDGKCGPNTQAKLKQVHGC